MDSDEDCPDLIDVSNKNKNSSNKGYEITQKVPVTIITGHLGSGKTTLLNYVLNEQHNKKVIQELQNQLLNKISFVQFLHKPGALFSIISAAYNACRLQLS